MNPQLFFFACLSLSVVNSACICVIIPENQNQQLIAPSGIFYQVTYATYGIYSGSFCTTDFNQNCHSDVSASIYDSCVGKSQCSVLASNDVFGDPCYGYRKSLLIQLECNANPLRITSPVFGAYWITGETYLINWISDPSLLDSNIQIQWKDENSLNQSIIVASSPNDGEFVFTVPLDMTPMMITIVISLVNDSTITVSSETLEIGKRIDPTCWDGIKNGDETGVDCGGSCPACPTCSDGMQNGDESGTDCGGSCNTCREQDRSFAQGISIGALIGICISGGILLIFIAIAYYNRKPLSEWILRHAAGFRFTPFVDQEMDDDLTISQKESDRSEVTPGIAVPTTELEVLSTQQSISEFELVSPAELDAKTFQTDWLKLEGNELNVTLTSYDTDSMKTLERVLQDQNICVLATGSTNESKKLFLYTQQARQEGYYLIQCLIDQSTGRCTFIVKKTHSNLNTDLLIEQLKSSLSSLTT